MALKDLSSYELSSKYICETHFNTSDIIKSTGFRPVLVKTAVPSGKMKLKKPEIPKSYYADKVRYKYKGTYTCIVREETNVHTVYKDQKAPTLKTVNDIHQSRRNFTITHLKNEELRNRYLCEDHFNPKFIKNATGKRKVLRKDAVPVHYRSFVDDEEPQLSPQPLISQTQETSELNVNVKHNPTKVCKRRPSSKSVTEELAETPLVRTPKQKKITEDSDTPKFSDDSESLFLGVKCNQCLGEIVGFRYVCVQCVDWDMCSDCEARGNHAAHYVLRVPAPRPQVEIHRLIEVIQKKLKEFEDEAAALEAEHEIKVEPCFVGPDVVDPLDEDSIVPQAAYNQQPEFDLLPPIIETIRNNLEDFNSDDIEITEVDDIKTEDPETSAPHSELVFTKTQAAPIEEIDNNQEFAVKKTDDSLLSFSGYSYSTKSYSKKAGSCSRNLYSRNPS